MPLRNSWLVLLAVSLTGLAPVVAVEAPDPNLVFILVDDLGWGDLGAYGQTLAETPHLDRLAEEGMKFSHAYAPAPICSASRAAILTGRSPARLQFEFVTKAVDAPHPKGTRLIEPVYPVDLPLEEVTVAELLKPAGYISGYFGKWHLTQANDRYLGHGKTFGPAQQGFDVTSEERGSHPYAYGNQRTLPPFGDFQPGEYASDALTDEAIAFLGDHRSGRFLLYLSHYYVHDPVHTRCRWLHDKYRDKATRLGLPTDEKKISYAAFVETMDHLIGRVLAALDEFDLRENTLVMFTSDNGGHPNFASNRLRGSKWTLYEGGVRVPLIARWPGRIAAGSVSDVPVIGMDLLPTWCDVAKVPSPSDRPLDGVSLVPVLTGGTLPERALSWHFPFYHPAFVDTKPVSSFRQGTQKLIYFHEDRRVELYDLAADPMEEQDLGADRPDRAATMRTALFERLRAEGARLPRPSGK